MKEIMWFAVLIIVLIVIVILRCKGILEGDDDFGM